MSEQGQLHAASVNANVIHTPSLADNNLRNIIHPRDPTCSRLQLPVGDKVGLTKTGVHYCRLPPGTTSTALHWHSHEDEWAYIVDAGRDCFLLTHDEGTNETKEVPLTTGDFLAFPAGTKVAHGFRTGKDSLVYLMGGSRESMDICHYPEIGQRLIIDRNGENWLVDEQHVKTQG
ncbi:unnamed protein product [Somion occarium]|uniref:Cupin type-2 domain-containing protein n=1 Tax=Somion occarium TaxID=3059160 RepID=A0ABP1CSI9_9APHY